MNYAVGDQILSKQIEVPYSQYREGQVVEEFMIRSTESDPSFVEHEELSTPQPPPFTRSDLTSEIINEEISTNLEVNNYATINLLS